MDKLCGPESLPVVYHRFSDGVDVLKCVSGFIKEVSEAEQSYANALQKLVKSPLYELHSNMLMQLLGSNPYEEIGTVKHTWCELGTQLSNLAGMHAKKAKSYLNEVRQPLLDLAPKLDETRKEIRNKFRQLRDTLEAAASKHSRTKVKYQQIAEAVEKHKQKVLVTKSESLGNPKSFIKMEEKLVVLKAELQYQEEVYHQAYEKHVTVQDNFDRDVKELFLDIQEKENERVYTIKKALQEFARTLSNTAPSYLEAMQRILISMDQIDSTSDIESFVQLHATLVKKQEVPAFEQHPASTTMPHETTPTSQLRTMSNGRRRGKLRNDHHSWSDAPTVTPPPLGTMTPQLTGGGATMEEEKEEEEDEGEGLLEVGLREGLGEKDGRLFSSSPSTITPLTSSTSSQASMAANPEGKPLKKLGKPPVLEKPERIGKLYRPRTKGMRNGEGERREGSKGLTSSGEMSSSLTNAANHMSKTDSLTSNHHQAELPASQPEQQQQQTPAAPAAAPLKPVPKPRHADRQNGRPPSATPTQTPAAAAATQSQSETSSSKKPPPQKTKKPQPSKVDNIFSSPRAHSAMSSSVSVSSGRGSLASRTSASATGGGSSVSTRSSISSTRGSISSTSGTGSVSGTSGTGSVSGTTSVPSGSSSGGTTSQESHGEDAQKTLRSQPRQGKKVRQHLPLEPPDPETEELLFSLQVKAVTNDYYGLLKVDSNVSAEELGRARRDRTKELHPDHFANDEHQKQIAQEELVRVNQAYQDVLEKNECREYYDLLCTYRAKYPLILRQNLKGLNNAHAKFTELRKKLSKSRCPQHLLDELDSALHLLQSRMEKLSRCTSSSS